MRRRPIGRGRYHMYIMGSLSGTLYIGFTADLHRRVWEHKQELIAGFTKKYSVDRLLYFECFFRPLTGIAREKQVKGWTRKRKIALIESVNPSWKDLAADWYG